MLTTCIIKLHQYNFIFKNICAQQRTIYSFVCIHLTTKGWMTFPRLNRRSLPFKSIQDPKTHKDMNGTAHKHETDPSLDLVSECWQSFWFRQRTKLYPVSCLKARNFVLSLSREVSSWMMVWHMRVFWSIARSSSFVSSVFSFSSSRVRSVRRETSGTLSELAELVMLFLPYINSTPLKVTCAVTVTCM